MTTLQQAMAAGPVLLDGGLATLLEAHGHDLSSDMWSARLLLDDPAELVAAHREYYEAGAQVAITASYQASFEGFAACGLDRPAADAAFRRSVECALTARDSFDDDRERWVAASVGPYGAMLADGSEYRGDYGRTAAQLRDWHRPRFEILADAGADVLAVETVPCLAEVQALVDLLDESSATALVVAVRDRRTNEGGGAHRGGLRTGRFQFAGHCGRGQLLPGGTGGGADGDRRVRHREAGGRLSQQRRGLGRRRQSLDWGPEFRHRAGAVVDGGGRGADRWVLPGRAGGDRGAGRRAAWCGCSLSLHA